jgi:hypothetical protein
VGEVIRALRLQINFSPEIVVWGGGEPTISEDFYVISNELIKLPSVRSMRILTNSLKYSGKLAKLLTEIENSQVITSIDAGTERTFQIVRGVKVGGYINRVMENLVRYNNLAPGRITLKYIFNDENCDSEEVEAFLDLCQRYQTKDFSLQISNDFKCRLVDLERLKNIVYMFQRAREYFDGGVVIDEIIRRRIDYKDAEIVHFIKNELASDPYKDDFTFIVGSGEMLDLILRTEALENNKKIGIIDFTREKRFLQLGLGDTKQSSRSVFIGAVQGFTLIKKELERNLGRRVIPSKALLL